MFPFYTSWKYPKTILLKYSGGVEWKHWPELGKAIKFELRNTQRLLVIKIPGYYLLLTEKVLARIDFQDERGRDLR